MPFERAEIQIPVNKYECPQRLSFSPGNLFWGSFTNHNTGNYLRHGINITTNQRLSPTFRGNGNTIIVGDSQKSPLPIFPEGRGTSVHRLFGPRFGPKIRGAGPPGHSPGSATALHVNQVKLAGAPGPGDQLLNKGLYREAPPLPSPNPFSPFMYEFSDID